MNESFVDLEWHEIREAEDLLNLSDFLVVGRFIANVQNARDRGYEDVCVYCGVGVNADPKDVHEWYCPCTPDKD